MLPTAEQVAPVQEGIFFTTPPSLPRGRHQLGRDEVLTAQRERLMIAATELMAAGGYRAVALGEIASRARISRAAFYECFADKDECIYAAYDRFIAVLITRLVGTVESASRSGDWDQLVSAVVSAYLENLQTDPVVARAFQVEMDALGRPARDRRRAALAGLAALLKGERDRVWPGSEDVPVSRYVAAVYAVRQLACDTLDAEPEPNLAPLATELAPAISTLLVGQELRTG